MKVVNPFKNSPPPEPVDTSPFIKSYDIDALFRKLGIQKDSLQKEQLPNGEWRCEYCDHVNTIGMLDCHHCGAKKSREK